MTRVWRDQRAAARFLAFSRRRRRYQTKEAELLAEQQALTTRRPVSSTAKSVLELERECHDKERAMQELIAAQANELSESLLRCVRA